MKDAVAIHVALAPVANRVYVSYLWPGMLGVLDPSLTNETLYLSPFQNQAVIPIVDGPLLGTDDPGKVILSADGRGGVHRISVP